MSYKLFLDDERMPVDPENWVIVRSFHEAIEAMEVLGFPNFISFDHDLGSGLTGYDFCQYLVELDMDKKVLSEDFSFYVHSQNPIGKKNIEAFMNNYLEFKANNE